MYSTNHEYVTMTVLSEKVHSMILVVMHV